MKAPFALLFILLAACSGSVQESSSGKKRLLDNCHVVARHEVINGDTLTVCDYPAVTQTLNIPISRIAEEMEVVPLQAPDNIPTLVGRTFVSENYILISQDVRAQYPYLLFKRDGTFVRTIGQFGNGPNEFFAGIDEYIDDENNCIYIMSYDARSILLFDIEGNILSSIPLPYTVPKGCFRIDTKRKRLTVIQVPFRIDEKKSVVWIQDLKGNIIQEIDSEPFEVTPDYSNGVISLRNNDTLDFYLFSLKRAHDTLFHYHEHTNRFVPKLTLNFSGVTPFQNALYDLTPLYYLIERAQVIYSYNGKSANQELPPSKEILIDKQTLRGCYVNWTLDILGNIPGPTWESFGKGYFVINRYPYTLKEQLTAALKNKEKLPAETVERMEKLNNSLTEESNNVLVIGKLKR